MWTIPINSVNNVNNDDNVVDIIWALIPHASFQIKQELRVIRKSWKK